MIFKFIYFIISLSFCKYKLNIDNIYLNYKNNFSITLNIKTLNISKKIIVNNIFSIILESENIKKKKRKITFICNFIHLKINNSEINCFLNEKNLYNLKGLFYFRLEYFKRSFLIQYKKKLFKFTIEILEEIFYIGMIKSFHMKKNNIKFNYKISNVIIPISMALNDEYTYPTLVAITSILENSNPYTKYDFYILHTPDFMIENKIKIKNLKKKYQNKCSINFINMTNFRFKNALLSKRIQTISTYYRLILPDILPNIDKIIYLDGDTIIFDDLKEMYDINMDNYYYKGFLDINDRFNLKIDNYICAGVLLINLEILRKDDIVNKMYDFMIKNNKNLYFHDQSIINGVCSKKIGILPPKFGIFNYNNLEILYKKTKKGYKYKKFKYSNEQLKNAYFHPTILHCVVKPWKNKNYARKIWLYFAEKTLYYNEIKNKYKI